MANIEAYLTLFVVLKTPAGKRWKKFGSKFSG
jgi:hypothetical protein